MDEYEPDLDSEVFLAPLLEEFGQKVVEPLGSVNAGESGGEGKSVSWNRVPPTPNPTERTRSLRGWAHAGLIITKLVASLQIPPKSSHKETKIQVKTNLQAPGRLSAMRALVLSDVSGFNPSDVVGFNNQDFSSSL